MITSAGGNVPGTLAPTIARVTVVSFKRLSSAETNRYLACEEWRDKAGGYAIQGLAAAFVKSVNGCYFNVVGLPLHDTLALLGGLGFDFEARASSGPVSVPA